MARFEKGLVLANPAAAAADETDNTLAPVTIKYPGHNETGT